MRNQKASVNSTWIFLEDARFCASACGSDEEGVLSGYMYKDVPINEATGRTESQVEDQGYFSVMHSISPG